MSPSLESKMTRKNTHLSAHPHTWPSALSFGFSVFLTGEASDLFGFSQQGDLKAINTNLSSTLVPKLDQETLAGNAVGARACLCPGIKVARVCLWQRALGGAWTFGFGVNGDEEGFPECCLGLNWDR